MTHPRRRRDPARRPATRTGSPRSGTACARGRGRSGPRAPTSNSGVKWLPHMTTAIDQPGDDRVRQDAHDPRVQERQQPAPARLGRTHPQEQRHRRRQGQQRRRDEDQQDVLDHVDREQGRVVAVDPRHQRERRSRPSRPGRTTSAGAARGFAGWAAFTRPTAQNHQSSGDHDGQRRERLERPAEQERCRRSAARPGPRRGRRPARRATSQAGRGPPATASDAPELDGVDRMARIVARTRLCGRATRLRSGRMTGVRPAGRSVSPRTAHRATPRPCPKTHPRGR